MSEHVRAVEIAGVSVAGADGLSECSAQLAAGSVTAVVGPHWSGVPTFLKVVAGLCKPQRGQVRSFGRLYPSGRIGPWVSYTPEGLGLYRTLTVRDTLRFARYSNDVWDQDYAEDVLDTAGIARNARIGNLDQGAQRIAALAVALGRRPLLVVLDNPFGPLDPGSARVYARILMTDVAERATTVVYSVRHLSAITDIADSLLVLRSGSVALNGSISDLIERHTIAAPGSPPKVGGTWVAVAAIGGSGPDRQVLYRRDDALAAGGHDRVRPASFDDLLQGYTAHHSPANAGGLDLDFVEA